MEVYFYTFTKRVNSTAQPTGGTKYDCILKSPSAVVRPRIALVWSGASTPAAFNYAYIADFGRYYWITDWTFADRQWIAQMSVDVLATYKTAIGASSKYVLRAASDYDTKLMDDLYPAKAVRDEEAPSVSSPWATYVSAGRVVLGISGLNNVYTSGGIGYLFCTVAEFNSIINAVFTNSVNLWPTGNFGSTIAEAFREFGKLLTSSVENPWQLINSAMWVPFTPSTGATPTTGTLQVGNLQTGVTVTALEHAVESGYFTTSYDGTVSGTEMMWEKVAPYRRVLVSFPPFGLIELDTALLVNVDVLRFDWSVDLISGEGVLRIRASRTGQINSDVLVAQRTAQVGIPLAVRGVTKDVLGGVSSFANALTQAVAGHPLGTAVGIGNIAKAASPQSAGSGSQGGGFAAYSLGCRVHTLTYEHADEDIVEKGRPLCKVKTLNTLSGYILCEDGDIDDAAATLEELNQINTYLTGGFFYD